MRPSPAPLRVRVVHADDGLVTLTPTKGLPQAGDARGFIARDLAADVVELLDGAPEIITRRRDGGAASTTTLHPGHIAVLVRVNSHASLVRDALHAVGVPAVIGGSGSVFATRAGARMAAAARGARAPDGARPGVAGRADLLRRLDAPRRWPRRRRTQWEDLHWSLHRWAALLRDQGVASLYETVSSAHDVPGACARPSRRGSAS